MKKLKKNPHYIVTKPKLINFNTRSVTPSSFQTLHEGKQFLNKFLPLLPLFIFFSFQVQNFFNSNKINCLKFHIFIKMDYNPVVVVA